MIAVDTNILVYAHRSDSAWHAPAYDRVKTLSESRSPWAIPWPCVHEFYAVVTHARIYDPASTAAEALRQIDAWLESPTLVLLAEGDSYWHELQGTVERSRVTGAQIHDARVAAICRSHGVRELWTADRDFSRFPDLNAHNPVV